MSYGIGGCCPQCGGEPLTAGFAHRAECPTLRTNAVYPVGDRSLLRAPTDAAQAAAKDYWHNLHGEPPVHPAAIDKLEGRMLGAVRAAYAVDGLRGTEDRNAPECERHGIPKMLVAWAPGENEYVCLPCMRREDRALREGLEEIASEAYHAIPYYAYGDNEAARHLANRLEKIAGLVRVLQESVEGEQRT